MSDNKPAPPKPPSRFSWPMRLFLAVCVFDIVGHSLLSLLPYRDWLEKYNLERFPKRLPTRAEIAHLDGQAVPGEPSSATERMFQSLDSVWDYFKPWPSAAHRPRLRSWRDHAMFSTAWLTSRMDFFDRLVGTSQRWTMFSPNASRGAVVARLRLLYADGSVKEVRLLGDPADLTSYAHWFEEKTLVYELKVTGDWDSRMGYCNYLAHREAANARESPLLRIYFYRSYAHLGGGQ